MATLEQKELHAILLRDGLDLYFNFSFSDFWR